MQFIDTHAHLYGEEFLSDIDEVLSRARQSGAHKIFLPSTTMQSAFQASQLSERYPGFLYPMLGLHPEDIPQGDYHSELAKMEKLLSAGSHPFIGIGEVGLDFYWDASRREEQLEVFRIQVGWALKYDLPLMIHSRSAHADLMACLEPFRGSGLRGVFHCFTGTAAEARDLLSHSGFMLGIGGVVTFKKSALPEALREVPLSRIVLETDSPYMAPVPHRGKRNESAFVPEIIARLAQLYSVGPDEVALQTTRNALGLFPLAV
ncbi:MAG: TatD family hydrolase [Bacteroidaceae bacterium]|nr:TatD family hydrolase [Bacteroidaceae bacterium]